MNTIIADSGYFTVGGWEHILIRTKTYCLQISRKAYLPLIGGAAS
jgi:hypothetical protein